MVLQLCGRVCRRLSLLSLVFIDKAHFFLMDRRVRPRGFGSSLSFKNPVSNETGFFVLDTYWSDVFYIWMG